MVQVGPLEPAQGAGTQGAVVGFRPRTGIVAVSRVRQDAAGAPRRDADGKPLWIIEPDTIQGIILLRKDKETRRRLDLPAIIKEEFNERPGALLPGVKLVAHPSPETGFFIHGQFPGSFSLKQASEGALGAHAVLRGFLEVDGVLSETGRPEDESGVGLPNQVELFVPLKPVTAWPTPADRDRPRSREELLQEVQAELTRQIPAAAWCCSSHRSLGSMDPFAPGPDECLVKIFGPDLTELDKLAGLVKQKLEAVPGVGNVRLFPVMGQSSAKYLGDRAKCARWGVQVADVIAHIEMAGNGKAVSRMVEGEKIFDICVRFPVNAADKLNLPVNPAGQWLRLRDLVTPVDGDGQPAPGGEFARREPACIYRENGQRLVSLKFRASGRSLAAAQAATTDLFPNAYHAVWLSP